MIYSHAEMRVAIRARYLRPLQDDVEGEEKLVMVLKILQYHDRRNNRYRLGPSLSRRSVEASKACRSSLKQSVELPPPCKEMRRNIPHIPCISVARMEVTS